jgi:hypothetical protein
VRAERKEILMGFLDRLFGRREEPQGQPAAPTYGPSDRSQPPSDADEQALQRYRYMLKTAPPETIEQAHEEAFAKLTPSQRAQVLHELAAVTPEEGRSALVGGRDDPKSLARLATRTEMRQPGVMERVFGGRGMGAGMGGMGGMGGSIFGSLVAGFVGSVIAQEFFDSMGDTGAGLSDLGTQPEDQQVADSTEDSSGDTSSDATSGYGDDSGGYSDEDLGGDSGSDWGGGDWGGGDWGGGDFGGGDW